MGGGVAERHVPELAAQPQRTRNDGAAMGEGSAETGIQVQVEVQLRAPRRPSDGFAERGECCVVAHHDDSFGRGRRRRA